MNDENDIYHRCSGPCIRTFIWCERRSSTGQRATAQNLQPMGSVSVTQLSGSPMDVRQQLAAKAEKEGASSYRITELTQGDHWHATAELYK